MDFIAWFKDIHKEDISTVGGKGANLGEMYNIGLPIPPGFFITAQCYKYFIEKTEIKEKINQILSTINIEDTKQLQDKANEIQKLIVETKMPEEVKEQILESYEIMNSEKAKSAFDIIESGKEFPFVAVRSSATAEDLPEASFAGQQASYLNVKGKDNLIIAISRCWASLFTARAIYYRQKNNFPHEKVLIAVVVQKMVNSDKAGVMFSINPVTNNKNEIVIEAAYGLGESVVSGSVSPDLYVVDKNLVKIKEIKVMEQEFGLFRDKKTGKNIKVEIEKAKKKEQVLSEDEILGLAKYAKQIEEHYGKPQDIEWAVEGDDLFIVQSRAVTTIKKVEEEKKEKVEIESLKKMEGKKEQNYEKVKEKPERKILISGLTASPGIASGRVRIVDHVNELNKIEKGDVLVTKMTNPDMVPTMKKAVAIITDEGGMTCHAAIVSREMGIPCIVGTEKATQILKENSIITVDATHGSVYEGRITREEHHKKTHEIIHEGEIITGTAIKVIMDLPDFAEKAAQTGADGIGLVRLEFMIAENGIHPAHYIRENKDEDYTNMLAKGIAAIAKPFVGKPVWVRTSDIRTDEYSNLKGADQEPKETDPMIGWHAIRRALDEPRILKAEFRAIKKVHDLGLKNVGVMLPFVIRTDEVRKAKEIMRELDLEPCKDIEFGVMIETPAACWIIEDLCRERIDFISFGTNDLTQLTLGVDRNNQLIAKLFDELHPAVLGEIEKVVKICKKYNVKTSICGQAGSNPKMAEFLVKIGIDSISANPDAVHTIKEVVAKTERRLLLDAERKILGRGPQENKSYIPNSKEDN
jgi:pyruvate,water dikinase